LRAILLTGVTHTSLQWINHTKNNLDAIHVWSVANNISATHTPETYVSSFLANDQERDPSASGMSIWHEWIVYVLPTWVHSSWNLTKCNPGITEYAIIAVE
jgi:hypothetical protein